MPIQGSRFVVHRHQARRAGLHYDLRIEYGQALRDWAFRKEPPLEAGVRRFGLEQEEHDKSWLDFEGEIPEGYGAGTMEIWDRGFCDIIEDTGRRLVVEFRGERLRGRYVLLAYREGWLLFKSRG